MSLKAPKKPGSVRKIVRIPDDVAYEIDQFSMGMYTSRGEFILCAMREFSCALINKTCEQIHKKTINDIEEDYNNIYNELTIWINDLLNNIEITENDKTTNVMIYVPNGLITKMRYLYTYYPILKNTNVFARAAIEHQIQFLTKESLAVHYNELFYESLARKDETDFIRIEENLYLFIKKQESFQNKK